jgi:crotonobetainyl-CoA:carnitine CoA-transferase CaiB-like acyl-CoA transferase
MRTDSDLPPPRLGEHTAEVLASLGVGPEQADRLRAAKVIA